MSNVQFDRGDFVTVLEGSDIFSSRLDEVSFKMPSNTDVQVFKFLDDVKFVYNDTTDIYNASVVWVGKSNKFYWTNASNVVKTVDNGSIS